MRVSVSWFSSLGIRLSGGDPPRVVIESAESFLQFDQKFAGGGGQDQHRRELGSGGLLRLEHEAIVEHFEAFQKSSLHLKTTTFLDNVVKKQFFRHYYDTNLCDFVLNSGNKFLCLFLLFVHSYQGSLSVTELYQKKQFIDCENS